MVGFHKNAPGVQVSKYTGKVLAATFVWTEREWDKDKGSFVNTRKSKVLIERMNRPRVSREYLLISLGERIKKMHPNARLREQTVRKAKTGE
jgi:hypothetical protein